MPDASATALPAADAASARLLGDIGGTNARFAWQAHDGAPLTDVLALPSDAVANLGDAMTRYLRDTGRAAPPLCAIGIANPITGDEVRMTNRDWSFSISALKARMGFERFVVINDFTALALALPDLAPGELRQLGGGTAAVGAPIGLIGPGTGLGVSGLIPTGVPGRWSPLQGEGGHVSLAPANEREAAVIQVLHRRFGHASAERAISGQGLENLHLALSTIDTMDGAAVETPLTAAEISARALAGSDPRCIEALELFCALLGSVAGNLALTLGATGGVYVGGGIVPRLGDAFVHSSFRARFEDKGRFRDYLAAIPVFVIDTPVSPALRGVSRAL